MNATRRLIPLVLGVVLVACEDDATGPSNYELAFIARNFAELGRLREDAGDVTGAVAAAHATLALRSGIRPARVSITVDGVTEAYMALEIEHALANDVTEGPVLTLPIVSRTMVAWRGSPPERVVAITIVSDTGEFGPFGGDVAVERPTSFGLAGVGIMFERGSPPWLAVDGGARSTRQTIGEECPVRRPSFVMQLLEPVAVPSACNAAVFFTRFSMRAVEGGAVGLDDARTRVIEMDGQDVHGVRLQYPPVPVMCPMCR